MNALIARNLNDPGRGYPGHGAVVKDYDEPRKDNAVIFTAWTVKLYLDDGSTREISEPTYAKAKARSEALFGHYWEDK